MRVVGPDPWVVRLTAAAEADSRQILYSTLENFGRERSRTHTSAFPAALNALASCPAIPGVKEPHGISANIRTAYVARRGRKGWHFVVLRAGQSKCRYAIDALRLHHNSMDLECQLALAALPRRAVG